MHSAFISTRLRYRAMPLAGQLVHKRSVHPGPLVLRTTPLKSPTPTPDRDRTVSRRSEPSSRTALIGEQPNPSVASGPQDAMIGFSFRQAGLFFGFLWHSIFQSSIFNHSIGNGPSRAPPLGFLRRIGFGSVSKRVLLSWPTAVNVYLLTPSETHHARQRRQTALVEGRHPLFRGSVQPMVHEVRAEGLSRNPHENNCER